MCVGVTNAEQNERKKGGVGSDVKCMKNFFPLYSSLFFHMVGAFPCATSGSVLLMRIG